MHKFIWIKKIDIGWIKQNIWTILFSALGNYDFFKRTTLSTNLKYHCLARHIKQFHPLYAEGVFFLQKAILTVPFAVSVLFIGDWFKGGGGGDGTILSHL